MANIWFTSDFHLGHFNIIRYCNRPFVDTQEMNAAILERMNASVKAGDVLYFLGDFCMGIVLCHYAMKVWPQHSRGTWQLYGHSHGNLPDDPLSLSMDVGVDSHDFRPWHFDEIQAIMKIKAEAKAKHLEGSKATQKDDLASESQDRP